MKKILILVIFSLMLALMGATILDDAMLKLIDTGHYEQLDGKTYWMATDSFEYDGDAIDYVAEVALIMLYGKAGWSSATLASDQKIISDCQGVAAYYEDWEYDDLYLLAIDMNSIIDEFKTEEFGKLDVDTQRAKVREYIDLNGDFDAEY